MKRPIAPCDFCPCESVTQPPEERGGEEGRVHLQPTYVSARSRHGALFDAMKTLISGG